MSRRRWSSVGCRWSSLRRCRRRTWKQAAQFRRRTSHHRAQVSRVTARHLRTGRASGPSALVSSGGDSPATGSLRTGSPATDSPGTDSPGTDSPARTPGYARGTYRRQPRREPAIAAPWERLIASILDWFIIFVVSVLLFLSPLAQVWRDWQAILARYPDLYSPAAQAAIASIQKDPATEHALLYWFISMFGIALVYYWVQHAAWGATLGKRVLGMRVVTTADRSSIGVRAAGLRAVTFLVGPAVCLLLAIPLSIPGALFWLADTGLPMFDSQARCIHDKLAGTIVVRQRWLDQQARSSQTW